MNTMAKNSNVCKVCGRNVEYWSVPKNNGKTRFYAFHVGDTIPEGSVKFEPDKISSIHKMRRRKELEEKCITASSSTPFVQVCNESTSAESSPTETSSKLPEMAPVDVVPTIIHEKPKEVIMPKEKVIEEPTLTEIHEIPSMSIGKPILDISNMKRNRFAITGSICKTLANAGIDATVVTEARSNLIAKGKDFPSLINAAAPYVQIVESGQPIAFQ